MTVTASGPQTATAQQPLRLLARGTAPQTAQHRASSSPASGLLSAPPAVPSSRTFLARAEFRTKAHDSTRHPTTPTTRNPTGRDLVAAGTEQCPSDSEDLRAVRVASSRGGVGSTATAGFQTCDDSSGDDPRDVMGHDVRVGRSPLVVCDYFVRVVSNSFTRVPYNVSTRPLSGRADHPLYTVSDRVHVTRPTPKETASRTVASVYSWPANSPLVRTKK